MLDNWMRIIGSDFASNFFLHGNRGCPWFVYILFRHVLEFRYPLSNIIAVRVFGLGEGNRAITFPVLNKEMRA
jgi:hypothetical protein